VHQERPDVVGFANYGWNENLNRRIGEYVRRVRREPSRSQCQVASSTPKIRRSAYARDQRAVFSWSSVTFPLALRWATFA
jgi:hypothetical protein